MKTRTDLLNHLAEKHGLKRYLEIGVQVPELNFDKIICPYKVGVDPDPKANATICKTSDEYFRINSENNSQFDEKYHKKFDLIFIDGLHTAEQVEKDYKNALNVLAPGGFIMLHDCNPEKEEHTIVPRPTPTGHWNGDVYKFASNIWTQVKATVDIDNGCCVVRPHASKVGFFTKDYHSKVTWEYFDKNRQLCLNLISWDEFVKL
jgi:hypothetical protein